MQGLSLKNVRLSLLEEGKKRVWQEQGEMQFTHFGVYGPLVLSASAYMEPGKAYSLELDLKPALDEATLDRRLLHDFGENLNRDYRNALGDLLPRLMIPVVVRRSGIPPETKVNLITKEQRKALLQVLKHFAVPVSGTRPIDEAVITAGGIALKEVNPGTMASKLMPGLFFAGEVLDLDAYTGGFNLQIAWCTGHAAGMAAAAHAKGDW
jgi:predicted Rossmann fold flavoprotein